VKRPNGYCRFLKLNLSSLFDYLEYRNLADFSSTDSGQPERWLTGIHHFYSILPSSLRQTDSGVEGFLWIDGRQGKEMELPALLICLGKS
jgi:hypothetical protein